ncbi:helix-turn-helix domain-containing protein [Desemzia sp. C1]|uniref:helix-turn-helix domain-containing protein n=1 Tax=Desemzia sp. C1 TaxID=2892016 RepID=UPI001E346C0E|nr:helix-turn-helix transcriptional regulator [Desemzia sp. C1]MCI3029775.1 helix-turn-helix domain-containing protein [Desemzia sp. C1]
MEIDKKAVGLRIKSIRISNGLTLEEFGKLFDASKGNVSLWEKGSSIPNNERLKQISRLGHISVDTLLYGKEIWNQMDEKYNPNGQLSMEVKAIEQTHKKLSQIDVTDIGSMMNFIVEQLESGDQPLKFEGSDIDSETKELLKSSLENTYNMAKKINNIK